MRRIGVTLCALLLAVPSLTLGSEVEAGRADFVRTGMTIVGAAAGLAAGASIGIGFSMDAIDTPLSNTLLLTIPVAAAGAAAGALAGRWMADVALRHRPSPLFALIEGAAAGAMLAMIAETMMPEAYEQGGSVVGMATLLGFLAAFFFKNFPGQAH